MIFLESPWPILLLGIAAEAILAIALVRTGRGVLLWAMIGVGLVVVAGVVVERLVVTERERVAETINGAARAVEKGDLNGILSYVSPSAAATRAAAQQWHGSYEISEIKVRNLDVKINKLTSPPTALAEFNVLVTGRVKGGMMEYAGTQPGKVTLQLRLEGGRWLIADHKFSQDPRDF
jgi:hypothetical protein